MLAHRRGETKLEFMMYGLRTTILFTLPFIFLFGGKVLGQDNDNPKVISSRLEYKLLASNTNCSSALLNLEIVEVSI